MSCSADSNGSNGSRASMPPVPPDKVAHPIPILVVNDNAAQRLALRAVLSPLGYSVVEADSGVAALRCVMAQDFAVILLDVRMPGMDGFETAALIRKRRQSQMTPIIFITSFGRDEIDNADGYTQGAVDFIFAPVPPDELRAKVSVFANLFVAAEELAVWSREVQASADHLRFLTDAAPIGIFQTDAENRYVYTNPRWSEITGISAEQALGHTCDTIIGSAERAALIADLPDGGEHRSEIRHRFEIELPGSDSRKVVMTLKSIPDADGGISGWIGTLGDASVEASMDTTLSLLEDSTADDLLNTDLSRARAMRFAHR
jgi:PAS domain S-box-containing protein